MSVAPRVLLPHTAPELLNRNQLQELKRMFQDSKYIKDADARALATKWEVDIKRIKAWFMRKRYREKRNPIKGNNRHVSDGSSTAYRKNFPLVLDPLS